MAATIFINYRREDAAAVAHSIYDRFARTLGTSRVFIDVDTLKAGQHFERELERALGRCNVILVLIGPRWLDALRRRAATGEPDYVVAEIEAAISRGVTVIPVSFDGAILPRPEDLPQSIASLAKFQRHVLTHERFGRDLNDLLALLRSFDGSGASATRSALIRVGLGFSCLFAAVAGFLAVDRWSSRSASSPNQPQVTIVEQPAGAALRGDGETFRFVNAETLTISNQRVDVSKYYVRILARLRGVVASTSKSAASGADGDIPKFDAGMMLGGSAGRSAVPSTSLYEALFRAARERGLSTAAIEQILSIYAAQQDFTQPVTDTALLDVLMEANGPDGDIQELPLRVALRTDQGDTLYYRFNTPEAGNIYLDANGSSPPRVLVRRPVAGEGVRLSAGFGMRKHPILGHVRPHVGVDWSAPIGTPVVAAGDGVVEEADRKGEYGNYVRIRHRNMIKTAYAHLQKFASGLETGTRVEQGQIIGYVGNTGLSAGPHLHFEVLVNDQPVDSMAIALNRVHKLSDSETAAFNRERDRIEALMRKSLAAAQLKQN